MTQNIQQILGCFNRAVKQREGVFTSRLMQAVFSKDKKISDEFDLRTSISGWGWERNINEAVEIYNACSPEEQAEILKVLKAKKEEAQLINGNLDKKAIAKATIDTVDLFLSKVQPIQSIKKTL